MPYNTIKSQIYHRFIEANNLLNHIKSIEDSIVPPAPYPIEYKILKGLFYVQLYACIEFSIHKLVVDTLGLIKAKQVLYKHLENTFHTISLHSKLQTVRDCDPKKFLDKSADVFIEIDSISPALFDELAIAKYLQNIKGVSFSQLTKTLGMPPFNIATRVLSVFDEISENRNKVAHGRDSAENVGSAPSYNDLYSKYNQVYVAIGLFANHFENFYNANEFIKINERGNY